MTDSNPLIRVEELQPQLGGPDLRIVDCRFDLARPKAGRAAYLAGHIPGAVYADLNTDLAGPTGRVTGRHPLPDAVTLAGTLGRLGIGNDTQVVVYDDLSGAVASRAWWLLRWLGHRRVQLLEGGIARWESLGHRLEEGVVNVEPKRFSGAPRNELILETREILAIGNDRLLLRLIDARDGARFRGEDEPIDPVAGHIPGAVSLPFAELQRADGSWLAPEALRERLSDALGGDLERPWSVMCGSGVTACHLAISAALAGIPEPRVYVGSWSEWISDSNRPVASAPG